MRFFVLPFIVVLSMSCAAFADPVHGIWKTQVDEGAYGFVEIDDCGANICGKLVRAFDEGKEVNSANIGTLIVWGMERKGEGRYRNGRILQPKSGKEYSSKLDLKDKNTLSVSGCIGPFCKRQTWTRVK